MPFFRFWEYAGVRPQVQEQARDDEAPVARHKHQEGLQAPSVSALARYPRQAPTETRVQTRCAPHTTFLLWRARVLRAVTCGSRAKVCSKTAGGPYLLLPLCVLRKARFRFPPLRDP